MIQISRIEEIFHELRGVARVRNHKERLWVLEGYENELLKIGGINGPTIKGVLGLTIQELIGDSPEEGVLNMTVEDLLNQTIDVPKENRGDYYKVLEEWKRLYKESVREVRLLEKFKGSATAFKQWFIAYDDAQVEAIFGKTYTPTAPLDWKGSPADACKFAVAVWGSDSNVRLNNVFKRIDKEGAKFVIKQQLKFRERKTDRNIIVPEILKVIARYTRIGNNDLLEAFPPLRLFQSQGIWEYLKEDSTKVNVSKTLK